jgi:hypothetical protein
MHVLLIVNHQQDQHHHQHVYVQLDMVYQVVHVFNVVLVNTVYLVQHVFLVMLDIGMLRNQLKYTCTCTAVNKAKNMIDR